MVGRLDDDAAGREIGAGHVVQKRVVARIGRLDQVRRRRSSSSRLCGGMFVAMPTAIPLDPLASRFGKVAGSTSGSRQGAVVIVAEIDGVLVEPSSSASAIAVIRASV
jgi:hypothetical protein